MKRLCIGLGLSLLVPACAAKKAKDNGAAPPSMKGSSGPVLQLSDDADEIDAQLERAQLELSALEGGEGGDADFDDSEAPVTNSVEGDAASAPSPALAGGGASSMSRCERIETLADQICQLRDHVCRLATEHEEQPRYSESCERAEQTCERAQQAADDCP